MKKAKTYVELAMEVRRTWNINPRTRVHDSQEKKDNKKQRRSGKKSCREFYKEDRQDFLFSYSQ